MYTYFFKSVATSFRKFFVLLQIHQIELCHIFHRFNSFFSGSNIHIMWEKMWNFWRFADGVLNAFKCCLKIRWWMLRFETSFEVEFTVISWWFSVDWERIILCILSFKTTLHSFENFALSCVEQNKNLPDHQFGLCSNWPKTVLPTDLFVVLTDKYFIITDSIRCLNNLEFFDTTDRIGYDNIFVGQDNKLICSVNHFRSVEAQPKFFVDRFCFSVYKTTLWGCYWSLTYWNY
jgi:hypothetical protein